MAEPLFSLLSFICAFEWYITHPKKRYHSLFEFSPSHRWKIWSREKNRKKNILSYPYTLFDRGEKELSFSIWYKFKRFEDGIIDFRK
jgi:hypothetical protein